MTAPLTLDAHLRAQEIEPAGDYPCDLTGCRARSPAFGLVRGDSLGVDGFICGGHFLEAARLAEADAPPPTEADWSYAKARRDLAVNALLWAVSAGTPLTAGCQALHAERIAQLHRLTIDHATPEAALAWIDGLEPIAAEYPPA